jgi:hypothetical protein
MRRSLNMVGLLAVLLLAVGCEREQPRDRHVYDPELDGPPAAGPPVANPTLLADQKRIAEATDLDDVEVDLGDPVSDVKAVVQRMIDAAQANNMQAIVEVIGGEGGRQLRPLLEKAARLPDKAERFQELVTQRLGMEVPQNMQGMFSQNPAPGEMPGMGELPASPDELSYTPEGDRVVVTGMGNEPVTFIREGGQWVINVPADPQMEQGLKMMEAFIEGPNSFLDEAIAGIENGQITQANFDQRMQELGEKHLAPMMEMMGAMFQGAADGNAEGTGQPPAAPHEFDFGDNE